MIIKIIVALLVFMVVVVVHEFGHFIFAKRAKIKVNEFAVGMGPKIFSKKKGDTLYSLRALPIGGFCAMEGEDDGEEDVELNFKERGHFNGATLFGRISTIFAGPFFNFILSFLILFTIFSFIGHQTTTIDKIADNSIAQKYGIKSGDKIVYIENNKIDSWKDVQNTLLKLDKEEVNISIIRNNEEKEILVKFENAKEKTLGISPKFEKNLLVSIKESFNTFFYFINSMFDILRQLLNGKVGVGQLSGPIGVVGAISSAASNGWYSLLYITAFLSVNLGFINLLPIPALDGGRLVFLFIELILGRPISRSKEALVHTIGFIFLMCLILFVSFKDVLRLGILFGVN